jgi:hypothetical protein
MQPDITGKMLPIHLQKLALYVEQQKVTLLMYQEKKIIMVMYTQVVNPAKNTITKHNVQVRTATR